MSSYATASDETLVNSYTTNAQVQATTTALADGGWVVNWWGYGTGDSGIGILQQRYAADGDAVGSETLVNSYTTGNQASPTTVALSDGGWVVTWYGEGAGDSVDNGIFQQRYAANGNTVGSEILVNTYITGNQSDPRTTALTDGGWVVTWHGYGTGDSVDNGIFQQRYAANGNAVGSEILVNSYTTNEQYYPTTTGLADGGWVVTWYGEGTGENSGIFQQRYAANGHTVGSETLVNSYTTNDQINSSVTALPDGGWVVTWEGEGTGDGDSGIFQQRYAGDGDAVGSETRVNTYITNTQDRPTTTVLADGGWVVLWHGEGAGDSEGIFQQRYAANGDAMGSETQVNSYTTGSQTYPTVTALANGGWIVTWHGEGTGDVDGIFQRHFAADIDGSNHSDKLIGTDWGEYLIGYAGNDRLDGGDGNDVMVGGFGNDTYVVNSKGDKIEEWAAQGTDTVLASVNYTLTGSVENLTLTGKAALAGTGNALANHLIGNVGANVLKGLAGADFLTGGKGDDKLYGGTDADHFIFLAGDGGDTIRDFDSKGSDHDVIDLSHVSELSDFADLKANHMEQDGSSVVIDFTAHDSVTLEGVKIKDLSAAEFHF
jgi:Ca2+-binding RTX toxin-like protein